MLLLHLPAFLATCFARLATARDPRSALRLPALLAGLLGASGRRTCTAWFRAADIGDDFRQAYHVVGACGRRVGDVAVRLLPTVDPLLGGDRLRLVFDDTPTARWGPHVEGAGLHPNPNPGPAGERLVYGHVWVTLGALAQHPDRGTVALPLQSALYVRAKDIATLEPDRQVPFRTKLELAADLLHGACVWRGARYREVGAVVDGGYAKRPFLQAARQHGVVVVGRLAKNAALGSLPAVPPPGRRGRKPIYGKHRLALHLRAGQSRGWETVTCVPYRCRVTKTIETFVATWRPAGGAIRVVVVRADDGWRAYFCTNPDATVAEILEAVADRGAIEKAQADYPSRRR